MQKNREIAIVRARHRQVAIRHSSTYPFRYQAISVGKSFTAAETSCRASVYFPSLRYTAARLDLARASSCPPRETASPYA